MALNQRRRQKQLARKAAQASARAKALRAGGARRVEAGGSFHPASPAWPVHDAWISDAIRKMRQGTVILSRKLGDAVTVAVFLVDVGCMGVKSAFGRSMHVSTYAEFLERFRGREDLIGSGPACVRKLVEGAVSYASDLGFPPDPDYRRVRALFGDIDPLECAREFEFGDNGKPSYVSGPYDSPARVRSVMEQLRRKCGPDGFHFMVASPEAFGDDLGDLDE